ncbi:MAG: MATE family efflux transporter [Elusimicrobia bacterium]|nr:MATE family efflux transporter [Elusimicrobiota bacterium]
MFKWHLIAMFNSDPAVIAIGARYLLIVGGFYVVFSGIFVLTGVLRGAGDAFVPMIVTILSLWAIRIPVSAWLAARMGTDGIWWGIPIAWTAGLLLLTAYYRTGRWQRKAAVKAPVPAPPPPSPDEDEAEWNVSKF